MSAGPSPGEQVWGLCKERVRFQAGQRENDKVGDPEHRARQRVAAVPAPPTRGRRKRRGEAYGRGEENDEEKSRTCFPEIAAWRNGGRDPRSRGDGKHTELKTERNYGAFVVRLRAVITPLSSARIRRSSPRSAVTPLR
ncbi:hypothetical protein GN956_G24162 [Arapaima gigas]